MPPAPTTSLSTSQAQGAVPHPGTITINVQGAFIVDDQKPPTPVSEHSDDLDYPHSTQDKDIRLPNHTAVVSHVAVDVCILYLA